MRERGRYQIQCMKSRSSTGVGQKIDLDYDIDTMRITDSGASDSEQGSGVTNILSQIKTGTTVNQSSGDTAKVNATVDSSKLKNMLAGLKKVE
jgi:hypothetical protein